MVPPLWDLTMPPIWDRGTSGSSKKKKKNIHHLVDDAIAHLEKATGIHTIDRALNNNILEPRLFGTRAVEVVSEGQRRKSPVDSLWPFNTHRKDTAEGVCCDHLLDYHATIEVRHQCRRC